MVQPARCVMLVAQVANPLARIRDAEKSLKAAASRPLAQRFPFECLSPDGEGERGRDHQQRCHDRYEQGHGCSSFGRDICSPATENTPFEIRSDCPRHRR